MISFLALILMGETRVTASDVAMVTRVGIFKTTNMMGTRIKASAAPTMPALTPTTNALLTAI
ncbi:hypothetical protein Q9M42_03985 [Marinococcus luteus]|nr:hypothetical protein [Marinococcus luteus]MDZ5782405.1 hypothetical protein [Marinococcus luteus]